MADDASHRPALGRSHRADLEERGHQEWTTACAGQLSKDLERAPPRDAQDQAGSSHDPAAEARDQSPGGATRPSPRVEAGLRRLGRTESGVSEYVGTAIAS